MYDFHIKKNIKKQTSMLRHHVAATAAYPHQCDPNNLVYEKFYFSPSKVVSF